MNNLTLPVRRILTGVDANGRSVIAEDAACRAVKTVVERPGYRVSNVWCTTPRSTCDATDSIEAHSGILPPKGGTLLRIIDVPPEPSDEVELAAAIEATFKSVFTDAGQAHNPNTHPGMHSTPTIDYAILLSGQLVAVLERGETVMNAGDVLIQRGTVHAWANRSGKPARVAFVLTDPNVD